MPQDERPPEPWRSFFDDLDQLIPEPVTLHCFGGFALLYAYGVARTTNDVDFISIVPNPLRRAISDLGGYDSALHKKHRVCLDAVTVATPPDSYESRLQPLFRGSWQHLELYALEAHDLALSKLTRNSDRDRDDVQRLAKAGHLDPEILRGRYLEELRPYLTREAWHDQTLQMWIESSWPPR